MRFISIFFLALAFNSIESASLHTSAILTEIVKPYIVVSDVGNFEPALFPCATDQVASYADPEDGNCTEAPGGEPDSGGSRTSLDPYWEVSYSGDMKHRTELVQEIDGRYEIYNYTEVDSTWNCDRYVPDYRSENYDNIHHGRARFPNTGYRYTRTKGYRDYINVTPEAEEPDWRADWRWEEQLNLNETKDALGVLLEREFELHSYYSGQPTTTIYCKESYVFSQDDNGNTLVQITRTTDTGDPSEAEVVVMDPQPYNPEFPFIEWCPGWEDLEIIDEGP